MTVELTQGRRAESLNAGIPVRFLTKLESVGKEAGPEVMNRATAVPQASTSSAYKERTVCAK